MRYLKLSTLFMLPIAFGLTLGAAPQPAEAGKACKRLNLPNNCVRSSDVKNLKAVDIKDEPGVASTVAASSVNITGGNSSVLSATLVAPRPGVVIATASGSLNYDSGSQLVHCGLSTASNTFDASRGTIGENDDVISWMPFSATQTFVVPKVLLAVLGPVW